MRFLKCWCFALVFLSWFIGLCQCDNWYVIVSTSRYWFNYRHLANSLSIYTIIRQLGVPDSRIIMMNSDSVACDPRNSIHGSIYNDHNTRYDLCGSGVETDYEGDHVSVDAFINVMTGRHLDSVPYHKRLHSTNTSKVLLYMAGHGGDEFLKFHDHEELTAAMLGAAVDEMSIKNMFGELMIIVDTCQASTLGNYIEANDPSRGITFIASSHKDENSYGYNLDEDLGVALIDRFTFGLFDYFGKHFNLFSRNPSHDTSSSVATNSIDPFEHFSAGVVPKIFPGNTPHLSALSLSPKSPSKSLMQKLRAHSVHSLLKSMDYRYLYSNIFTKQSGNVRSLQNMPLSDYFT